MDLDQKQYESLIQEELRAAADAVSGFAEQIEQSIKSNAPLPIAPKELLAKISMATAKVQTVIDEHAQGFHVSKKTMEVAASTLQTLQQSMDCLISALGDSK